MLEKMCCFVGNRKIDITEELENRIYSIIFKLILEENINTFLFGSKSEFNSLCYEKVSKIKEKYPKINRVYVRAEFPEIDEGYQDYLLKYYENTFFPENILKAGKAVYIKRNFYMIDESEICVFYYNENDLPKNRKSGTKIALDYAIKKHKKIILLP